MQFRHSKEGGKMKKAGLYCRVSTDIQMEGYSIDAQQDFLKTYCKMHEIKDYEFYIKDFS